MSTDTGTLVDRLRAAILARKALAEAAEKGEWTSDGGEIVRDRDSFDMVTSWVLADADRDHIVANQPKQIILDCATSLDLLEECSEILAEAEKVQAEHDVTVMDPPRHWMLAASTIKRLAEAYGITECDGV